MKAIKLTNKSSTRTYCFIDSQNLYLGIRNQGWELDYKKFYVYLKEKYQADKVFIYLGYIKRNHVLYENLRSQGYTIIFNSLTR